MAANAITIPGAEEIEFYFSNGTYADAQVMPILKGKVVNELGKVFVKDGVGNLCKLMCDASGSSNTPASRVFFSDSEGAASSDSVLIYDSINKKLGIGVSPAIGAKLHLHQASTANALIKLSNTTTGSGEHDGLNIGVVGESYVVRTQFNRPIVIETENEPGQYLEIAKFQKTGSISNTILNSDLKVNTIVAKSTAASVFLTHENNTIKTRTAAQVRADIGAAAVNHTQAISTITNLQDTLNNKQPLDTDLTAIAGLTHSNRHVLISNGTTWTRRALEEADLPNLSAAKITSGTLDNARLSFDPSSFAKLSLGTVRAAGGFATSLETGRDVFASGLYTYRFMVDALNKPAGISLGSVLTWGHGGAGAGQLAVGWAAGDHNKLVFRSLRDTQDDWWGWKEIYHTGNFDPSTKSDTDHTHTPSAIGAEPAISGTAYKVLSIQSDGSGVKTGCLRDLGNYAAIDNAERFAIIHSTDQAAISLQSQGDKRFWISSAPSVLNIGGAGTTAPENGQLQIYHDSRVVIPSLPLLVGKSTATTGNPYKLEVEGNTLVNGKLKTNKLNNGSFVRKTLSLNYTAINLDNETTWNFRIKTALTNSPAIFFGNAQEGDEVWVYNEYNSQPIVVMLNFNSGYDGITISQNNGLMLKCVGESHTGGPAFVYGLVYSAAVELKP
jgi:hypothetical protein